MKAFKVQDNIIVDAIIVDSLDGLGSEWVAAPSKLHGIGDNINDTLTTPDPTYIEQRAAEYPSIGDQLDALFHAGVFPAEMAATIQAVKDAHPKPTEGDA